ncbi:hypothetical protein CD30_13620 [Ureibacillus massiliensis 4400831 = CIP 108448 = CCUG 49529]|uniref:Uncharacterized protein n=1 Tax=Ureibacillus massiliensis 4400831 = CIP 108448 = CCUG 49529 TaxID=1211035 RepID=A0A0A3IZE5_9BACL|nr:hypothetical protein [Ureibacillus massiliensis]KGR90096.1 hypothetical protein CD30_13620 [Ureibacillus massiliensis 4400831 = CIP 108448 = CCUG 49529]
MTKRLLIIRSASMQQLDKNLPEIVKTFPEYQIDMLTHEHSVKLVEKYDVIKNVIVYPYNGSFDVNRKVDVDTYDAVLVPVTNLSGSSFYNVLNFSLTIKAEKRFICNLVSEIWEVTPSDIKMMKLKSNTMTLLSSIATAILFIPLCLVLPFKLMSIQRKED